MMKSKTAAGILFLFAMVLIIPAAATLSLQDIQVAPPGEGIGVGESVNASALLQIIPQGPTTFIEGHTLVLSTDLEVARWNVAVLVDGIPAAVIPQTGSYVFINGFLLSYPTNRDVSVSIQVEGKVPALVDGTPIRIIQAEELNNQGQVIGDSEQVIIRSVMNPGGEITVTPSFGESTTVVVVPVTTTRAGISPFLVPGGVALVAALFLKRRSFI